MAGTNVDLARSFSTQTPESFIPSWRSRAAGTELGAIWETVWLTGIRARNFTLVFGFSVLTHQRFPAI